MVFLKLDVSWVFAGSPMARCLGPNATRDLEGGGGGQPKNVIGETSVRTVSHDWRLR